MKTNFNFEEKSKINPFAVPDGYFEEFAQKMERQIEKKNTPKRISFAEWTKPLLYAAAAILAIFTIGTIFVNNLSKPNIFENQPVIAYDEATNQMLLEELSEDDMIEYILANAK
jgi:hypothetical protein